MFSKHVRESTKKDITLLGISGLIGVILWVFASPLTPTRIYYGDATHLTIQNVGFKQATDVTIEFDPNQKLTINYINYTKLSGEIITDYTNHDQKIYHISHMYPKDRAFFYVDSEEKGDGIDLIVRSNEVEGKSADEYFENTHLVLVIFLGVVMIWFTYQIFMFVKHFLNKDIAKQNSK